MIPLDDFRNPCTQEIIPITDGTISINIGVNEPIRLPGRMKMANGNTESGRIAPKRYQSVFVFFPVLFMGYRCSAILSWILIFGPTLLLVQCGRLAIWLAPARLKKAVFGNLRLSGLRSLSGLAGFSDGKEFRKYVATDIELRIG